MSRARRWTAAVALVTMATAVTAVTSGCAAGSTTPVTPGPAEGAGTGLGPRGDTIQGARVDRVVDGDTVHVLVAGEDVTVRLIGIDTPETVKPDSPVECFGPEASDFAKAALEGRSVTLEFDDSQGMTDRYGRTLAYVWVEDPGGGLTLFNLLSVAGGYADARQYGPTPYAWKSEFEGAEEAARSSGAGRWGSCQE